MEVVVAKRKPPGDKWEFDGDIIDNLTDTLNKIFLKRIIKKSEKTIFIYHLRNSLLKFIRNSFLKIFTNSKIFSSLLNKDIFNFKL